MKSAKLELQGLKIAYRIGHKLGVKDKEITKKFLRQPIRTIPSISDEIVKRIEDGTPMLLARLGGTEGRVAGEYCERMLGIREHYSADICDWLYTTSVFFADNYDDKEKAMDEYAQLTLNGLSECDFLSATFPPKIYMPYFFKYYAKNAIATFSDSGPYFDTETEKTWVRALKNKRVLVINSFTDSIKMQYERKEQLVASDKYELPIDKTDVDKLRAAKLVEGRISSLFLSASAAKSIDDGASYIKNKGFDDKYYKDLVIEYLRQYKTAKKKDIRNLLWDKLPDALSDTQKENKMRNLLTSMKRADLIDTDSNNQQKSNWILKEDCLDSCLNKQG